MARKAEVVTREPPRWLPMLALVAAALAIPAALGWIGGEIYDPCPVVAAAPWMGLFKMFDRMPLASAVVVTAVLFKRYRFHWAVSVALLVVSIALIRVGADSYQKNTNPWVIDVICPSSR